MNNLGAELELDALPLKGLKIQWSASVSNAEYDKIIVFSGGGNKDFSGNKPLYNPEFASFTAVQYTKQFCNNFEAFIRGEHRYSGAYYFDFDNVLRQSPYNVYNGRLGARYKNFEFAIWGKKPGRYQIQNLCTKCISFKPAKDVRCNFKRRFLMNSNSINRENRVRPKK